jgi:shikimate kinase/3-dehydroquinate synthase
VDHVRSPLTRHVALVGFMGAGKSTLGAALAERLGLPFVDVDREIERDIGTSIQKLFEAGGEPEFRAREEEKTAAVLGRRAPVVVALGGGAVEAEPTRALLRERATTIWLEVELDDAWSRAQDRPLAQDRAFFRGLYERRQLVYAEVADARARDLDDAVLAAARIHVGLGSLEELGELVPGDGRVALVSDAHVSGIHGADAQLALGARLASTHTVPPGEEAKTLAVVERLWRELVVDRSGVVVALGGGATTDVAGFAASAYLRGVAWVPVPTTLVGQVDAAIGGKTGIDLPAGKNLVGAFHWPRRTVIDPALLETLPERERRGGLAEVVKTGLLAGEPLWELPDPELVRRCAAFKAAVCLRDPFERGERAILNLGHTFAHALETAASYEGVTHGEAVALGLLAALRLSGQDTSVVDELLRPRPVRVDRDRAWVAIARDKKARDGRPRLVLLEAPGRPVTGVELPEADVRRALDDLIAG